MLFQTHCLKKIDCTHTLTNWKNILSAQFVYTKIWITNSWRFFNVSKFLKFLSSNATTSSVSFSFLLPSLHCYLLHIRIRCYILDLRWFEEEEKSHILFIVFMTYYAANCLQLNNLFGDDNFFWKSFELSNLQNNYNLTFFFGLFIEYYNDSVIHNTDK